MSFLKKKLIVICFLFLVGCDEFFEKVTGLKDETFNCSGIGGQSKMMNVAFKISLAEKYTSRSVIEY